ARVSDRIRCARQRACRSDLHSVHAQIDAGFKSAGRAGIAWRSADGTPLYPLLDGYKTRDGDRSDVDPYVRAGLEPGLGAGVDRGSPGTARTGGRDHSDRFRFGSRRGRRIALPDDKLTFQLVLACFDVSA